MISLSVLSRSISRPPRNPQRGQSCERLRLCNGERATQRSFSPEEAPLAPWNAKREAPMKRLTLQILLLQLAVGLVPVYADTPLSPKKLMFQEGKLSVQIVATSLPQVMAEIGRLSGVKVLWLNGEENEERVSAQFTNLPLADALTRILAKKNF